MHTYFYQEDKSVSDVTLMTILTTAMTYGKKILLTSRVLPGFFQNARKYFTRVLSNFERFAPGLNVKTGLYFLENSQDAEVAVSIPIVGVFPVVVEY